MIRQDVKATKALFIKVNMLLCFSQPWNLGKNFLNQDLSLFLETTHGLQQFHGLLTYFL